MGCGASSKQRSAKIQASESSEKTVTLSPERDALDKLDDEVRWLRMKLEQASSSSGSTSSTMPTPEEEELMWLRKAFDAEKREKAWLMGQFELLEAKVKTRNEECSRLRAQISAWQTSRGSPPPEQPVLDKDRPKSINYHRQPSIGSPASPTTSLKERRGLKLGVDTGQGPAVKAIQSMTNSPIPPAVSSANAAKMSTPKENAQAAHSANNKSTYASNNPTEPPSPLLMRRVNSTNSKKGPSTLLPVPVEVPQPQPQLKIEAIKASTLECPESPKRARKRSKTYTSTGGADESEAPFAQTRSMPQLSAVFTREEDTEALVRSAHSNPALRKIVEESEN